MKLDIKGKLMLSLGPFVLILLALIFGIVNHSAGVSLKKSALQRLEAESNWADVLMDRQSPGRWRSVGGRLYKGKTPLEFEAPILRTISRRTGSTVVVFYGGDLAATSDSGLSGIKVPPEVSKTLAGTRTFNGVIVLAGKKYLAHATTLREATGASTGVWLMAAPIKVVTDEIRRINLSLLILVLALLGLGQINTVIISRLILRPLPVILDAFKRSAEGDLTAKAVVTTRDEFGTIADGFNDMMDRQRSLMRDVSDSSVRVDSISEQIAGNNQDLAQRTQEQASTLEEIAATVEEVNASIHQVATNAETANEISKTTYEMVVEGRHSVDQLSEAMKAISSSGDQIGEIIKLVNDLAFQTNLLALNAAVEAARAGEQGRGFAVVAAEIRNLAGRSTASAKEIENLIRESGSRMELGNRLASNSMELLEQIVENTKQTSTVIREVSAAMSEQATSARQINTAIEQLNQVTQKNSVMVEEVAASGSLINDEARSLRSIVDQFVIEKNAQGRKREDEFGRVEPRLLLTPEDRF